MADQDREMLAGLKGNRGFTLIELLMVITILGVLAAVGLLSVLDLTAQANDSAAMTDVKSVLGQAGNIVLEERDVFFFHAQEDGSVIGDQTDFVGSYIPQLHTLSPGVRAQVVILNMPSWGIPGIISIETSHDRGTDYSWGLNGKKTYWVSVDGASESIWQNF